MRPQNGTRGVLLLTLLTGCVIGRPLREGNVTHALVFLTRFGYLLPSEPWAEFRGAVREMQRFAGLPPTGRVDAATERLMGGRRCGLPDVLPRVRRYAIQGQKWPSTNLTWSVRVEEGPRDRMVRSQLRRAFAVWSGSGSALRFAEVDGDKRGDIAISFLRGPHGDGYPFDGEGSVLAHAFFPGEGIGGDAHFDAEERWTQEDADGVNLFAVAAHEIGHSLGLSHSSTPGSLMFPYYQVIGEHFQLPVDDADGIRHLYGVRDVESEPTMPPLASTTTISAEVTTSRKLIDEKTTHKPRKTITPQKSPSSPPNICNSSIDAISVIRREIFIFKGKFFWRFHSNRTLRSGYPVSIDRFWNDLSADITRIDALYERQTDTKIVFFSGKNYWLFSANQLESGYPKPLTDLGLPDDVDHIDAAMVWGHNGKTYIFSGTRYWKFDEEEGRVELDYPRSIQAWRGIPPNIDAAFQWTDGNTYFFKRNKFWKFVDVKMRVDKPSEIGGFWFRCPSDGTMTETSTTQYPPVMPLQPNHSSTFLVPSFHLYLMFLIYFWYFTGEKSL